MASSPKVKEATLPAEKPERKVDIAPEDIQLGSGDDVDASKGKRKLTRPRSAAGTGLQL